MARQNLRKTKGKSRSHWYLTTLRKVDRRWLWLGVLAVVLSIGGVVWCQTPGDEKKLQVVIDTFEKHFLGFCDSIRPAIALHPNPYLREQLLLPCDAVTINRANQFKNRHYFLRLMAGRNERLYQQENINYFSYDLLDSREQHHHTPSNAEAAFGPTMRTLFLPRWKNVPNTLDILVAYHEVVHATQDVTWRVTLQSEKAVRWYLQFHSVTFGQKPRLLLANEATAYAFELEVMDAFFKGGIREMVKNGTLSIDFLKKGLGARENQESLAQYLVYLAHIYFPRPFVGSLMSEPFAREIAGVYQKGGFELFIGDPITGTLRPLR